MNYLLKYPDVVWTLIVQHLQMTLMAMFIAIAIALPLGIFLYYQPRLKIPILAILGTLYTIPSLALIILLVPLFGLNARSVIIAMVIYTQVILVRNISVALQEIDPNILEAAKGMGMSSLQQWRRVQLPLMMPIFLGGVRLATLVAVAIATIGAKFGAGGLGVLLFEGIQQNRFDKIWIGAIAVSLLAFILNIILRYLERQISPHVHL